MREIGVLSSKNIDHSL